MSDTHITVSAADLEPVFTPPAIPDEQPKPPSTALKALKARREQLQKDLFIDLQVPRWDDPEIFVRYGPMDPTAAEKAIDTRRQSKAPDFMVWANADVLARSCIGVFACLDGDYETKYSLNPDNPEGPWTRFDPALARALGLITDAAADVVRGLYQTDGDLINAASALTEWSGHASRKLETDFSTP